MNILEKQNLKNKLDTHKYEANQDDYDRHVKLMYLYLIIGMVVLALCSYLAPFQFFSWHRNTQTLLEKKNEVELKSQTLIEKRNEIELKSQTLIEKRNEIELKTLECSEQYIEENSLINIKNSRTICELNIIELETKKLGLMSLQSAGNLPNPSLPIE